MKPLKVAFLTSFDPFDKRGWSGTVNALFNVINKNWGEAHWLGPIPRNSELIGKSCNVISKALFHKRYNYQHSILNSLRYSGIFNRYLAGKNFDLIVAPAASTEIACLKTRVPIVYIIDATFALVLDYYAVYSKMNGISIREGNWIEQTALKKASLILSASQWAKQSVLNRYCIGKYKVEVVPFGANIENVPQPETVRAKQKSGQCRLLFLGVDWERKGGSIAFDTLLWLERMGLNAELTFCGCVPPSSFKHPRVRVIPFIDKTDPKQYAEFSDLLFATDFLLLPTRAEGFGIVFCESNAFGVPAITTDTGGVPSVITNGENGFMLPFSATGEDYAKIIFEIFSDGNRYNNLVKTSRETFEKRLNWDVWGRHAREIIAEKIGV
jgi:glycosyltransferase involved in cell wall biosynthesis